MKHFLLAAFLTFLIINMDCLAQDPRHSGQKLDDSNVSVSFELETTWHTVEGSVKNISGTLWHSTVNNQGSIQAEISFPVRSFDTENSSRDKKMRRVMAADQFPQVILSIQSIDKKCVPTNSLGSVPCNGIMDGTLSIRDITRQIKLPYTLKKSTNGFAVSGEISFPWGAFGVEDPSIIVAKVYPTVLIKYHCDVTHSVAVN